MRKWRREQIVRLAIVISILLSGAVMIPFVDMPVSAISWESLAGVYEPQLSVNETSGASGSMFAFMGASYPASAVATVYLDGDPLGTVEVDANGEAKFVLDTDGAVHRQYNVTLEVDVNASATQTIELTPDGEVLQLPPGFEAEAFNLGYPVFMPTIFR